MAAGGTYTFSYDDVCEGTFVEFSTGDSLTWRNMTPQQVQALLDEAYGATPPEPAPPEGAWMAIDPPAYAFDGGEWLLGG